MPEKILVAHISAGGATKEYAEVVAETLRSRGHVVELADLKKDRVKDVSGYSVVVAGMGVRMGMVYRKGKRFLARPDVAAKRLAVFLSSGEAIDDPARAREKFLTPLVGRLGLKPILYGAFPGKAPGVGKLRETTDPAVAKAWAERLADELG